MENNFQAAVVMSGRVDVIEQKTTRLPSEHRGTPAPQGGRCRRLEGMKERKHVRDV